MSGTFNVSVVTPGRSVLECEANFVVLPAHDGEMGILRNRAPLLCKLDVGKLRIETSGEKHVFFIDGGFAEMSDNKLTVLTAVARTPDQIDMEQAREILESARQMKVRDSESLEAREKAFKRARVQLALGK